MRLLFCVILILHSFVGCDIESAKIGSQHQIGADNNTQPAEGIPSKIPRQRVVQPIRCEFHLQQIDDSHDIETMLNARLTPSKGVTSREAVEDLIDRFVEIDGPVYGATSTIYGSVFIAIQSHQQPDAVVAGSGTVFPALVEAVCLGPDALPVLLDFLDDKRPTKLTYTQPTIFGGLLLKTNALPANPLNTQESSLTEGLRDMGEDEGKELSKYTATVGDICFVAIGQITGRNYQSVYHISGGSIGISSPVLNDNLCESVRKIWASDDLRSHLHNSLLLDFYTRSTFDGKNLDLCWMIASQLQVDAVKRLLYYYPDTGLKLARSRLQLLKRSRDDTLDQYVAQEVENEITVGDFIDAVSWSLDEEIQLELRRLRR